MEKKFFASFVIFSSILGIYFTCNIFIVFLSGELNSYHEISKWQQKSQNHIYDPLFSNDNLSYKYALFEQRYGEVVVTGSSRALQHQQQFYSKKMTNMGRSITDIPEAIQFFNYMTNQHNVKTVICIADYWWFNTQISADKRFAPLTRTVGTERSIDMFTMPILYALQGKLDITQLTRLKLLDSDLSRRNLHQLGLISIQKGTGFLQDGSRLEPLEIISASQAEQRMKDDMAQRLGKGRFKHGTKLNQSTIDLFFDAVNKLEQSGKNVVIIFNPVSPVLYSELSANPLYSYIFKSLEYMNVFHVHNYLDPKKIGVDNPLFLDFFHTGPVVEGKLLLEISKYDERVRSVINQDYLEKFTEKYARDN